MLLHCCVRQQSVRLWWRNIAINKLEGAGGASLVSLHWRCASWAERDGLLKASSTLLICATPLVCWPEQVVAFKLIFLLLFHWAVMLLWSEEQCWEAGLLFTGAIRCFIGVDKASDCLSQQNQDKHSCNKVSWNLPGYLLHSSLLNV